MYFFTLFLFYFIFVYFVLLFPILVDPLPLVPLVVAMACDGSSLGSCRVWTEAVGVWISEEGVGIDGGSGTTPTRRREEVSAD